MGNPFPSVDRCFPIDRQLTEIWLRRSAPSGLANAAGKVSGRYFHLSNHRLTVRYLHWSALACTGGKDGTGVPKGIRTPVTTVKGSCPRPLDDGDCGESWLLWWR